jgi:hypothetical protein
MKKSIGVKTEGMASSKSKNRGKRHHLHQNPNIRGSETAGGIAPFH